MKDTISAIQNGVEAVGTVFPRPKRTRRTRDEVEAAAIARAQARVDEAKRRIAAKRIRTVLQHLELARAAMPADDAATFAYLDNSLNEAMSHAGSVLDELGET